MNSYGILLKKLIHFTNIKLSNLAETVGYDTSYISKWCNKDKLPAAKAAASVNKCMSGIFAREIIAQEEAAVFAREFNIKETDDEEELSSLILHLLKDAYKASCDSVPATEHSVPVTQHRLLIWPSEIHTFFYTELPQLIHHMEPACHILCTMDISEFLQDMNFNHHRLDKTSVPVYIKMGLNSDHISEQRDKLFRLYELINQYHDINFDFYDNHLMSGLNMIVIQNCMAIQCSLDKDHHICLATIITDMTQVNAIYQKISAEFSPDHLLIHSSDSEELFYNGYRTEFYAQNNFQILLTHGFEFLLPPEMNPKLIQAAQDQGEDRNMSHLITRLTITWEEIFEKGHIDFFLLKTRLMRYMNDGLLYFADVVYHMSAEERKQHIQHVLKLVQKNPNIRFFIIDDEFIPNAENLFQISVYNNRKKLFLKNISRYSSTLGPNFYTVQNNALITDISQYFEDLHASPYCTAYTQEDLLHFYEKYGTMIERMLSI